MENRQAVYDLLKCFLEKRSTPGIDCKKELPGLLAYRVAKGCFIDPNEVFERDKWRVFGDKIFDTVIQDDKTAKKLMKPWQAGINALAQHEAEQKAAAAALQCLGAPWSRERDTGESSCPLPPSVRNLTIQTGGVASDLVASDPVGPPPMSPQAASAPAAPLEPEVWPTAPPAEQREQLPPPENRSGAPPSEQTNSLPRSGQGEISGEISGGR